MENNDMLKKLAQANAHLQNVHTRGKEDMGAMLSAIALVEDVMRELMEKSKEQDEERQNRKGAL